MFIGGRVFDISISYSMIYNMSDDDGGGGGEWAGCDGGDNGCCWFAANLLPFSMFFNALKANTVNPMPAQSSSCRSRKSPTVIISWFCNFLAHSCALSAPRCDAWAQSATNTPISVSSEYSTWSLSAQETTLYSHTRYHPRCDSLISRVLLVSAHWLQTWWTLCRSIRSLTKM